MEFFETRDELIEGEKKLVDADLIKNPYCMNLCLGGSFTVSTISKMGLWERTQEYRAKLRKILAGNNKGRKLTTEHKTKISLSNKGRTMSRESRAKISMSKKGKTHSEQSRKNMSEAHKGKRPSEITRRKMSESKTSVTQEQRQLILENTGKMSIRKIAQLVGCSHPTVLRILKDKNER